MEPCYSGRPGFVRHLLYFARDGNDVLSPARFRERYGFAPDGVNFYYGVNALAADHHRAHGTALRDHHRRFFQMVLRSLLESDQEVLLVNLGLWPFEPADPYGFVSANPELVRGLAKELAGYQAAAAREGKRLEIVVRYASEMNDPAKPGQPWGRPPGPWNPESALGYRTTLPHVRQIFREAAPEIRFTFSPAIRSDITGERFAMIRDFWPGDGCVDLVSCTWYAGQAAHVAGAAAALREYLLEWNSRGLPLAIDEMGGIDGDRGNDAVLRQLLAALDTLHQDEDLLFQYLTFFLMGKWGTDTTLAFLRSE